jgi:hypothetical protein
MSQGFKPLADGNIYTPLLVQNEIVTLPSASTIAVLRDQVKGRKAAPKALAVLADPVFTRKDDRILSSQPQQNNTTAQSSNSTRSALEEACLTLDRLNYSNQEAKQS